MGGLAAALALRRIGWDVRVFERALEIREAGAAISVWANATRPLRACGLLDALLDAGTIIETGALLRPDGSMLRDAVTIHVDAPGVCLHRADLQRVLLSGLPEGLVRTGAEFVSASQDERGVVAQFADGSTARGEILIGADGLNSAVRRGLLGNAPPVYRGYQCWRGVNPHATVARISETLGAGLRVGLVPLRRRGAAWWVCANETEDARDEPEGARTKLLRLLRGWHEPVLPLIAGTAPESILKNAIYDRPLRRGWSRGRMLLIGDAAHPTTPNLGQGGGMAIEDGFVLARCLERCADPEAAFEEFERLRFPRVQRIVARSLLWGRMGQWSHPLATRCRDILLRVLPGSVLVKGMLELMRYDPMSV